MSKNKKHSNRGPLIGSRAGLASQPVFVGPNIPKELSGRGQMVQFSFEGPLPHAGMLAQYEQVLPGLAHRITQMAENQASHRQRMERGLMFFDGLQSIGGQVFALIIALAGIFMGGYLVLHDKPIVGFFAGFTPLATLVGVFLYQSRLEKKKKEKKITKKRK